jgi:AcrR family transcriptional regulator
MTEPLKSAIRTAVLRLLDPLVKWLLEAGIGVADFLPLVKIAYVRAASERGRTSGAEPERPNVSRIAVITGLTRVEVAGILESGAADRPHDHGRQRAERVLSGWWNDSNFHDDLGNPAILPVHGGHRSFAALVERYSGARALVAAIRDELLRVKAIKHLSDGRLQALSRTYATVRWDPDGVIAVGEQLNELCATLTHNLKFPARPWYVRRVLNAQLDPQYVPMLARDIEQHAKVLADSFDDALNDPKATLPGNPRETGAVSLGVALYVFSSSQDDTSLDEPFVESTRRRLKKEGKRSVRAIPRKKR